MGTKNIVKTEVEVLQKDQEVEKLGPKIAEKHYTKIQLKGKVNVIYSNPRKGFLIIWYK